MKHALIFRVIRTGMRSLMTLLFIWGGVTFSSAQKAKLDSLKNLAESAGTYTPNQRIDIINRLSYELRVSYPDVVRTCTEKAIRLSKEINYKAGEIDAYTNMGLLYWLKPEYDKSLEYGLRSLHLSDSLDYTKGAIGANFLLGHVYNQLADFEKSEAFTRKGLDLSLETGDVEGIARGCNMLGNHYRRLNNGKEALRYYQMGVDHLTEKKVAIKNLLLTNIALYYINLDIEREKTKHYLEEALDIALEFENKSAEMLTYTRMGLLYTNINEFAKAEEKFMRAKDISLALGNHSGLPDIYKGLTDLKRKEGQLEEAQAYEVKYLRVKDSIFNLEKARQVAKVETLSEAKKKEEEIKALEQEATIQSYWKNALMVGGLILIGVSYYFFYVLRARNRKLKAAGVRERILVPATETEEISLDDKFLQQIRTIIEANMSDGSFSVEQLADKANINRTQLLRKIKGLTGLSPHDFIKDLRLKKAADMIRQNTNTITQIGYSVGFNDQSYFSKCFKKQFGITPKEFSTEHTQSNTLS